VNAPQICAFVGDLARFEEKTVGNITLVEADNPAGFTLLALDNKPIGESEKMVMTITTQMKNTGMEINGFNVLDYGEKPRIVAAARIKFNLKTDMEKITVFWLDESGDKSDYYEVFENNGNGNIPVTINTHEHPGVWFGVKKCSESLPVANFSADTTSGETPLVVHFTDESTDAEWWEWDFNNDGIIDSYEQNPTYTYTKAGNYSVSLTVSNLNGENTKTREGYMDVSQGPTPVFIQFQVDMQNETVSPEGVFLSGSFNDWESLIAMEADGSVYQVSYELMAGDTIYYRFFHGETGEIITGECNAGEDNRRMLVVPAEHSILDIVCFGTCEACIVNAAPVADAGENQTVDEGQTVTLDGSGSYDPDGDHLTFEWKAPEGVTLRSETDEAPTFEAPKVEEEQVLTFLLRVYDGLLFSPYSETSVTVRDVVGTEITERNEITLYPNPSKGKIWIETGSTEQNMKVEIVDLTGQIVYQTESNTLGMQQFDLSELNSGIYFVCIDLKHKQHFKKLIINK
jgi:PKD repeat protein